MSIGKVAYELRKWAKGEPEEDVSPGGKGGGASGAFIDFMTEVGNNKVTNPDTGNRVKVKSLKGPKGKKWVQKEFERWKEEKAKKDEPKKDEPKKDVELDEAEQKILSNVKATLRTTAGDSAFRIPKTPSKFGFTEKDLSAESFITELIKDDKINPYRLTGRQLVSRLDDWRDKKITRKAIATAASPKAQVDKVKKSLSFVKDVDSHGKAWNERRNAWQPDHVTAVNVYSSHEFEGINGVLRGYKDESSLSNKAANAMDDLEELFEDSKVARTTEDITVTRGVGEDHPIIQAMLAGNLSAGMSVKDPGYMSTTLGKELIMGTYQVVINVPKGSRGVYLGPEPEKYSEYPDETELLLDKGSKWKISAIEDDNGKMTVYANLVQD